MKEIGHLGDKHKVTERKKKKPLQANKYRHGFKYSTIPSSSHSASEGASLPGEINLQATRQQFHTSSGVKKKCISTILLQLFSLSDDTYLRCAV